MLSRGAALALLLALYAWLLWDTYSSIIAPTFGYLGEISRPPSPAVFLIAFIVTWIVGMSLPTRLEDAGDFALWLLYALLAVPTMLVPHFTGICTTSQAIMLTAATGLSFPMVALILRRGPAHLMPISPVSPVSYWLVLGGLAAGCYGLLFSLVPITLAAPTLTDVYDIRGDYRLLVGSAGPIIGYLVRFLGNVINPMLICRGLFGGPKVLVPLGLFGQLVIFSVTGFKLTLLSGLGIVAVAAFFRFNRHRSAMHLLTGAVALVLVCTVLDVVTGGITFSLIFVYRLILSSGTLPAAYASFFGDNPFFRWSDSFLSSFVHQDYSRSMAFTVGEFHTGSSLVTVNSHYVADGYGNLGLWGVFIEAVLLGLLLLATVTAGRGLPVAMVSCLLVTPLMALANSSPITSVLSNGFAMLILLLMILPREDVGGDAPHRTRARAVQGRPRKRSVTTATLAGSP